MLTDEQDLGAEPELSTEHCWHSAGLASTGGMSVTVVGGTYGAWTEHTCCWCGAHRTDKHRRIAPPGHGPKFPMYPSYSESVVEHHYEGGEHPCIEHAAQGSAPSLRSLIEPLSQENQ